MRGREEGKVGRIHAFYIEVHCIKNHCPPHPLLNTVDTGKEKRPYLSFQRLVWQQTVAFDLGNHPQDVMRDELKKAYTSMLAESLFTTGQNFKQWSTTENLSTQLQPSHRKERDKTSKNHTLRELESKRLFQHIRKNSEYIQLKSWKVNRGTHKSL